LPKLYAAASPHPFFNRSLDVLSPSICPFSKCSKGETMLQGLERDERNEHGQKTGLKVLTPKGWTVSILIILGVALVAAIVMISLN
jgi:hypothetical protein